MSSGAHTGVSESPYRWVIVALGGVMGCVAVGAMFSLAVFLAPMSEATGWSRAGISLGMTINCAQCHTHKFDPIKHDEYFKFYAFLNQDEEPEIEVPTEAEKKKRAEILRGIAKIEDDLLAKNPDLLQHLAEWELKARQNAIEWTVLEDADVIATNGVKFEELLDRSFIPRGDNPPQGVYYVKAKTNLKNVTGFRLELLTLEGCFNQ